MRLKLTFRRPKRRLIMFFPMFQIPADRMKNILQRLALKSKSGIQRVLTGIKEMPETVFSLNHGARITGLVTILYPAGRQYLSLFFPMDKITGTHQMP